MVELVQGLLASTADRPGAGRQWSLKDLGVMATLQEAGAELPCAAFCRATIDPYMPGPCAEPCMRTAKGACSMLLVSGLSCRGPHAGRGHLHD